MNSLSARDAILEPGIAKTFEQLVKLMLEFNGYEKIALQNLKCYAGFWIWEGRRRKECRFYRRVMSDCLTCSMSSLSGSMQLVCMNVWLKCLPTHAYQLGPADYVIVIFMNEFHSLYHVIITPTQLCCIYLNRLSRNTTGSPMLQWAVLRYIVCTVTICPTLQQALQYSRVQKEGDSGYGGGTSEAAHYTAL